MSDSFEQTRKQFNQLLKTTWEGLSLLADAFWQESQTVYEEARKDYEKKKAAQEADKT